MMEILNMSRRTGSGMRPRSALRDRGAGHGFRSLRDAVPDTRVMVAPLARPHGGSKRQDIARMRKLHPCIGVRARRSEEHTSELQSLMRISYAVFCLKKKKNNK